MNHIQLIKGFGVYHAFAIVPLMLPIISEKVLALFELVHITLKLPGEWFIATASEMLFINLFACVAFLWALVRINHPSRALGIYEGWGMLIMSLIVIYYVLHGASPLWLIIPLVDIPGGILHLIWCRERNA